MVHVRACTKAAASVRPAAMVCARSAPTTAVSGKRAACGDSTPRGRRGETSGSAAARRATMAPFCVRRDEVGKSRRSAVGQVCMMSCRRVSRTGRNSSACLRSWRIPLRGAACRSLTSSQSTRVPAPARHGPPCSAGRRRRHRERRQGEAVRQDVVNDSGRRNVSARPLPPAGRRWRRRRGRGHATAPCCRPRWRS